MVPRQLRPPLAQLAFVNLDVFLERRRPRAMVRVQDVARQEEEVCCGELQVVSEMRHEDVGKRLGLELLQGRLISHRAIDAGLQRFLQQQGDQLLQIVRQRDQGVVESHAEAIRVDGHGRACKRGTIS
jgi:hypothetical protein